MASKYKKGDWVRLVREGLSTTGAIGKLAKIEAIEEEDSWPFLLDIMPPVDYKTMAVTENYTRAVAADIEPWQPKVGERVRVPVTTNTEWAGEGEVIRVPEWCVIIKMLTGGMKGRTGGFYAHEIEPVTDALPVAEQPPALTIAAGRYYKTRDGRKVGPMVPYRDNLGSWEYKWTNTPDPDRGRLWREDGTSGRGLPEYDLVAEWVGTPTHDVTAATVDAINDEYGPVVQEVAVAAQQARMMIRTKNGYGFELARVGDYVWVDIGQKAPITVRADTIKAA